VSRHRTSDGAHAGTGAIANAGEDVRGDVSWRAARRRRIGGADCGSLGADGLGVETPVTLNASSGELGTSELQTDKTGHATGSWAGTQTATLTATAGDVIAVSSLKVNEATKLPPPSEPRPPTPQPEPLPIPTPAPQLSVALTATPFQAAVNGVIQFSASPSNMNAGEFVTAYQWDWDGDGTPETTTVTASTTHPYTVHGLKNPAVSILTSGGRSAKGSTQVIVYQ
jgi:hypothetical protein